ncbi:pyridoxamine 5'-phosphate oxidase family protein [Desulfospira joergensenii]|uniref:pyridoxamine 5'-phosphate oxidase family protein n=1 Tax=Desulfospira joergensenii TaxID=53329 RepID=UPI0003B678A4|nr:pyridoxamine 5'-phosphate oxidase family protein [Desulfospira joergensenii]
MTRQESLQTLGELFASQTLAVLSTQKDGHPYASLVAFSFSQDLKQIYFLTQADTRKFNNLTACDRVALLVSSACNRSDDFSRALAVTALGRALPLEDKTPHIQDFMGRHPQLKEFAGFHHTVMVEVRVETYLLVSRFENVVEIKI